MLRDVDVRDVTSRKRQYALRLQGYARAPIADVRIEDCTFTGVEKADVLESVRDNERVSR